MCKLALFITVILFSQLVLGQGQSKADSLYATYQNQTSDTTKLRLLNEASIAKFLTDRSQAVRWAKEAVSLANKVNYPKEQALGYYNLGYLLRYAGERDSSLFYLRKSEEGFKKLKDYRQLGMTNAQYAAIEHTGGDMIVAIKYVGKSVDNFKLAKDTVNISRFLGMLGAMHSANDNYEQALEISKESYGLAQQIGDSTAIGKSLQSLANIYSGLGSKELGEQYFKKSIQVNKKYGTAITQLLDFSGLGKFYNSIEKHDLALLNNRKALVLLDTITRPRFYITLNSSIALAYMGLNQYDSMKIALDNADRMAQKLNLTRSFANLDEHYAGYYSLTKRYNKAIDSYKKALNNKGISGVILGKNQIYSSLAECYVNTGDYQNAYKYQTLLTQVKDSFFRTDKLEALSEAETKFEVAKKDFTINLLEKEGELKERKAARQRLLIFGSLFLAGAIGFIGYQRLKQNKLKQRLRMEKFRNKVAADLHDDVGSTLSSIGMYSEVIKQKAKDQMPEAMPMLENMSTSSKELMDAMSDIVWTINPKNNSIDSLLIRIKLNTADLCEAKEIKFEYEGNSFENIQVEMDVAQNVYLVLKEAINNALKYADCSVLSLNTDVSQDNLSFSVVDNGRGFDIAEASQGNGMRTMKERMLEIGGDFDMRSTSKGTTVSGSVGI